ncbi:MAG: putative metallopeptidase [Planctomycetota bacterium]|jgi:hypothetical protein
MARVYTRAAAPMDRLVREVMHKHHKHLESEKIKIGTVFVETDADETSGAAPPALTDRGMPCLAKIRLAPTRDRILHGCDAVLEIDSQEYDPLDSKVQWALIDHELTHLRLKTNKEGEYVRDGYGRAKLELRPHDWEVSGFTRVVQRYGRNAVEALNFRRVQRDHQIGGQGVFDFMLERGLKDTVDGAASKGVASVVAQIPGRRGEAGARSVTIDLGAELQADLRRHGQHNKGRIAGNIDKVLKTAPRKTRAAAAASGASGVKGKSAKTKSGK